MPSPNERQRNNVRAGVFVTAAIILALAVVMILTDALEALTRSSRDYRVLFDVSSGVSNLQQGAAVRVGGVQMGKVKDVMPVLEAGQAFRTIAVRFDVDRRIELFSDARILITAPLIGSEAWLDIPSVGDPAVGAPRDGTIIGTSSVGALSSLLGEENADRASQIIQNFQETTASANELVADLQKNRWPAWSARIDEIIENSRAATSDVKSLAADINSTRWPSWAESVSHVMDWAERATVKLDQTIDEGHGLLSDSRDVVAENREGVRQTVENVRQATETVNTETLDKVHGFLDRGQQGLDQAVLALENLRVDYETWAVDIGEALANANLAAQQLKLTTIETRRSPWKLLYRPSATELEHELLYEAARSFAVAAADLKAASESVQRVLQNHGELIAENQDLYQKIENNLISSLDKYEKAQQQLIDVLFAEDVKP